MLAFRPVMCPIFYDGKTVFMIKMLNKTSTVCYNEDAKLTTYDTPRRNVSR